jgi:hypothetical protein
MAKKDKKKKKKFKSRSQEVLKTVYDKREERSRSTGKSMWRSDCPLPEFGGLTVLYQSLSLREAKTTNCLYSHWDMNP